MKTPESNELDERCTRIADSVVPAYRNGKRSYDCTGHVAKRWQAAYDGALAALRGIVQRTSVLDEMLEQLEVSNCLRDNERATAEVNCPACMAAAGTTCVFEAPERLDAEGKIRDRTEAWRVHLGRAAAWQKRQETSMDPKLIEALASEYGEIP